jgi:D-amino-acid dehydrogenase
LGWTMACGSGKLISDMVMGQQPDIRTDGLGMDRYEQAPSRSARPSPVTAPA